jgi:hypothetical protein
MPNGSLHGGIQSKFVALLFKIRLVTVDRTLVTLNIAPLIF